MPESGPDIDHGGVGRPEAARRDRGMRAHVSGAAAEACVAREYERRGFDIAGRRWRGQGGEIDLIVRDGADVIFVEVKAARDLATAATRLGPRQMERLFIAASEFLEGEPAGQLTGARFDVALVDRQGALQIVENAFAA